jgi:hypothetical protein
MLGDALNSPLQAWHDPADPEYFGEGRDGEYIVRKTHATTIEATFYMDAKVVFLQRDPRDVIISRLFYNKVLIPNELTLMGMTGQMYTLPPQYVYSTWVRSWYEHPFVDCHTSYEKLKLAGGLELHSILESIGANVSRERADEVFENHSFKNIKQQYGDKYDGSMHKGKVGEWRKHFTSRAAQYMNDILGEFMLEMGYIDSLDWWKELDD